MKKLVCFVLALTMAFALCACGSTETSSDTTASAAPAAQTSEKTATAEITEPVDDGTVYTMRIGAVASVPDPAAWWCVELEKIIEDATGGRIDVESYPSGTIGTTQQMIGGLQEGSVQGVIVPVNYYESYVPELGILGLPMFFESNEQAWRCCFYNEEFNNGMDELLASKGFVVGAWAMSAPSTIMSNKQISSFEDLKGLKIWTLPNSRITATWNAFGATPVNFDTGDLAVGLQQKTIDAAYTGPQLFNSLRLQEFASCFVYPTQTINFNTYACMLSKEWTDTLPADLYEILIATLEDSAAGAMNEYTKNSIQKALEDIQGTEGMTVWYTDEEFNAAAREALAPISEEFLASVPTAQALYDVAAQYIKDNPVT